MRRLLQPKNLMVRPPGRAAALREARYIAAIDILQARPFPLTNGTPLQHVVFGRRKLQEARCFAASDMVQAGCPHLMLDMQDRVCASKGLFVVVFSPG